MDKKLWQIGWKGGQTDGDVGPETVAELLNVEITNEGQIRPRDKIYGGVSLLAITITPLDTQYMVDPNDSSKMLQLVLYSTGLKIYKDLSTDIVAEFTWAAADGGSATTAVEGSHLLVHGQNIYCILQSSSGPAGVYVASYTASVTRFQPPRYLDGHSDAIDIAVAAGWRMTSPAGLIPSLSLEEVTWDITGWPAAHDWVTTKDAVIDAVEAMCDVSATRKQRVVLMVTPIYDRNVRSSTLYTYYDVLPVQTTYAVEYTVQFQFYDGSYGPVSAPVRYYAWSGNTTLNIGIGVTLGVCKGVQGSVDPDDDYVGLSESIMAINVYRKIMKTDNDVIVDGVEELLFAANVDGTLCGSDDEITGEAVINLGYEVRSHSPNTELVSGLSCHRQTHDDTDVYHGRQMRIFEGNVAYTSGWLNYHGTLAVFIPRCLVADGDHKMYAGLMGDGAGVEYAETDSAAHYYRLELIDTIGIYECFAGVGSNVYCLGEDPQSLTPTLTDDEVHTHYFACYLRNSDTAFWRFFQFPWKDLAPTLVIQTGAVNIAAKSIAGTRKVPASPSSLGELKPLVFYCDFSIASPTRMIDLIGCEPNEVSTVLPKTVTMAGGRAICLNVTQDSLPKTSRLVYSEFGRPTTYRKTNYIDYEARGDGQGVAIGRYAGRLLILLTTSSYILDISGGSDMTWREIGSYPACGCYRRQMCVETPVGVFFGSDNHIYWFNGESIKKIDDLGDRRITDTYVALTKSAMSFDWRSDLRQLWVISGATILVFDFDLGAWHKHSVDATYEVADFKFLRLANISGVQRLVCTPSGSTTTMRLYYMTANTSSVPFDWGVTTGPITMDSSEYVKKLKNLYIDTVSAASTSGALTIYYTDVNGSADTTVTPTASSSVVRSMTKVRCALRNYVLNIKIRALTSSGVSWSGKIESLGISFKPKKLK